MTSSKRQEFRIEGLSEPISHYTDAVRWGDTLYISGLAPFDADSNLIGPDDPEAQTRQIFRHMKAILDAAGASFADVLRVTVYLTNVDDRTKINPVRQEYFGDTRPASTLVEVRALVHPQMCVEIEAIVGLPG